MLDAVWGLIAIVAVAAVAFHISRPKPLNLAVRDTRPAVNPPFSNGNTTGFFGEMLTSVLLAREGWKQLETHLPGGQGLDGVYVREKRRGFEVLLVETKTTQVGTRNYDPAQMSDSYVRHQLDRFAPLHPGGHALVGAIFKALDRRSPYVRKELWHHDLATAVTVIHPLDRSGAPIGNGRTLTGAAHFRLMEALAISGHWFAQRYREKPIDG